MPISLSNHLKFLSLISIGIMLFASSCKSTAPALNTSKFPTPPPAISVVNVPLEIPATTLTKLLNSQLPSTLYQTENSSLGNGIEGDLLLKRAGTIAWKALDSQAVEIILPIEISGKIGLKRSGLGNLIKGRIPIQQSFRPTFVIDPRINPDWSIGLDGLELIDLGGELELDIFGMKVDLSGMLRQQIQKWAKENLLEKPSIFTLKPMVDLAWAQAGKPIPLEYEGVQKVFSIQPKNVLLQDFFDEQGSLNLWLGLNGSIAAHPADAAPSRAFPLPALSANEDSTNRFEIILPFSLSYAEIDELLTQNLANRTFRLDKKTTFSASGLQTKGLGEALGVTMDFIATKSNGKEITGQLLLMGKPSYDPNSETIRFEQINFDLRSESFQAKTGAGLKRKKIIRQMEKQARFPISAIVAGSISGIQSRLRLQTPIADFQIINLSVTPSGFYPQQAGLLIYLRGSGQIQSSFK